MSKEVEIKHSEHQIQSEEECFTLDIDPDETCRMMSAQNRRDIVRTANLAAVILILGVVLSFPLFVIVVAYLGNNNGSVESIEIIKSVFDKWVTVIGPLAGTAVGAYYGTKIASHGKRE